LVTETPRQKNGLFGPFKYAIVHIL